MRILLIEDHPIVRAGCRRLLQTRDDVEVQEAATAADGLRIVREFTPDIIVLDLNLPERQRHEFACTIAVGRT